MLKGGAIMKTKIIQKKSLKQIYINTCMKLFMLPAILIIFQSNAMAGQETLYPAGELNLNELRTKFFQLCDIAVQKLNLPEREYSRDTPIRPVPFYVDSYAVRALAVAYDLTGKEEYLETIKIWSDRMITNQEKMIPQGGYYMNYNRKPFETSGNWYVADCAEISMGILATAVRCKKPMEKQRYIKSVESFADLVLENYIGPNGGITDGIWSQFDGECNFVAGYMGQVFFKLYDETGNQRYLDAALNAVNWLNNYELIRAQNRNNPLFLKFNAPLDTDIDNPSSLSPISMIGVMLNPYSAGLSHIFYGQYPEIEQAARKQMEVFTNRFSANLSGKGESGTFEKYDVRKGKIGGKFGGFPFHIYVLVQNKIIPNDMLKIADQELQRIISEIFSYDEQLLTEFTCFSMISMAEKICPGSILRLSEPLYKIVPNQDQFMDAK